MLLRREMLMGTIALAIAPVAWAQPTSPAPGAPAASTAADRSRALWGPPYTRQQLEAAEQRFGFRFPPDLFEFLLLRRFARSPDWSADDAAIREMMSFPLEGIMIDVERNDFWAPHWGPRPATLEQRLAAVEKMVKAAPTLIPLSGEHFMPASPFERGNPVFSVFLTDVSYVGADLEAFAKRLETPPRQRGRILGPRKAIPFWTELSEVRQVPPAPPAKAAAPQEAPDAAGERG